MARISVIIICFNRKNDLLNAIKSVRSQSIIADEIIVVDNNSTDGTEALFSINGELFQFGIRYFRLPENLGVSGGRNYGIAKATGEIMIFLDDDALFNSADGIENAMIRFQSDPSIGIISFKIKNYYTKSIMREEFPNKNKSLNPNEEFETTYFIGAGHAIRREVFNKCGLYPEDYFYGMEELDLSFKVVANGFTIIYLPSTMIWHKKAPTGRLPENQKWIYMFRNRLAISYKYLGLRHFTAALLIWFIQICKVSHSLSIPVTGIIEFVKYKKTLRKSPISKKALQKLKKLGGRLWY